MHLELLMTDILFILKGREFFQLPISNRVREKQQNWNGNVNKINLMN